jgi:hypothetical protein
MVAVTGAEEPWKSLATADTWPSAEALVKKSKLLLGLTMVEAEATPPNVMVTYVWLPSDTVPLSSIWRVPLLVGTAVKLVIVGEGQYRVSKASSRNRTGFRETGFGFLRTPLSSPRSILYSFLKKGGERSRSFRTPDALSGGLRALNAR